MTLCQGCGTDVETEEAETGVEHECHRPANWDDGTEFGT